MNMKVLKKRLPNDGFFCPFCGSSGNTLQHLKDHSK